MDKKIENIGKLTGKVLLFGGVYSNLQALEAIAEIAKKEGISSQNCICTGDIIGYCAQPEETISFFKNWNARSIAGNVEIQLSENAEDCGCDFTKGSRCDDFSQLWYPFAKSKLSTSSLSYISELPEFITFDYADKKIAVVHGSYFNTSEFVFKSTPWDKKAPNFTVTESDVIIAGHCGLPFNDRKDGLLWLNPGVIGMPANDGKNSVWYMILDEKDAELTCKHHQLDYDYTTTANLMHKHQLPQEYATTIINGIWDNMEILPETESKLQGKQIQFKDE
ncbi:metallophosphoesterase family protein [Flavobacterium sp. F-380]|uniref:Metallophosphoesterase family protein n=1 Tax=Flavobacterium kayseriense TaxID=2764714 RepID=A0ABR7J7X8_9FLAO|nr:metallophosphoesterase family protein [Flavobacterium kayseriense]MBC5841640.1 metallophosphoesterase family protein [Flavobacterium kayseriense]MBC5848168.1 metallophosphoesterase family protein [Flavobacterium kayseriense]